MPSRIEYLNTEEVAISTIAFPGKISQSLSNVSFFFRFNDRKTIEISDAQYRRLL